MHLPGGSMVSRDIKVHVENESDDGADFDLDTPEPMGGLAK